MHSFDLHRTLILRFRFYVGGGITLWLERDGAEAFGWLSSESLIRLGSSRVFRASTLRVNVQPGNVFQSLGKKSFRQFLDTLPPQQCRMIGTPTYLLRSHIKCRSGSVCIVINAGQWHAMEHVFGRRLNLLDSLLRTMPTAGRK